MRLRCVFIALLFMNLIHVYAQKMEKVHGEYTYHVPENVTLDEGKRTALERAKIQALADAFGTFVSQNNSTVVKNENGKSSVDFLSIGGSNVKGEWIETIGEPIYNIFYESDMLVIKVEVDGKAREVKGVGIDCETKLLCNGTELKFESNEFKDGDDLYLYFKSPSNGYLAVYLLDENAQEVFCLLPYKNSGDPTFKVVHDKPYIFFSSNNADESPNDVDEYTMTCEHPVERNTIYVIFSPNMFAKANAEEMDEGLPRQLSLKDFQKWLAIVRSKDTNIQVINKSFNIKSK